MSAYAAVARYLFAEASSGTTPTSILDSVGSAHLTPNYQTSKAAWTSVTAGKGLNFAASNGAASSAYARAAAPAAFSGKTEASAIVVFSLTGNSTANIATLLNVVDSRGYDGSLGIKVSEYSFGQMSLEITFGSDASDGSALFQRFDWNQGAQLALTAGAIGVLHVVVDTTQATAGNRVKVWLNGSALTAADGALNIAQNTAIKTLGANDYIYVGNDAVGSNNLYGAVYYAELGTGQLTTQQISDTYTALIAANDVSPWATGPGLRRLGRESGSGGMGPAMTGGMRG